jgi:ABC-type transport system substrate-binding protein
MTMGTGPWRFDKFDPTRGIDMSANPKYWHGRVPVQHLSIKFIEDTTNMALAFRGGEIDVAQVLDPPGFRAASGGARVTSFAPCGNLFLALNTKVGPFSDIHVRRAASYAIDRSQIIKVAGGGVPSPTLIEPVLLKALASDTEVNKLLKSINTYPTNLTKARQELKQSKYPNGFSAELPIFGFGLWPQIMQAISGNLKRIGINLNVRIVTVAEWFEIGSGDKDKISTFFSGFECNSPNPGTNPDVLVDSAKIAEGQNNYANYSNKRADVLIEQGRRTADPEKRFQIYAELQKILSRDQPYIPLYRGLTAMAFSSKYKFPRMNPWLYQPTRDLLLGVKPN